MELPNKTLAQLETEIDALLAADIDEYSKAWKLRYLVDELQALRNETMTMIDILAREERLERIDRRLTPAKDWLRNANSVVVETTAAYRTAADREDLSRKERRALLAAALRAEGLTSRQIYERIMGDSVVADPERTVRRWLEELEKTATELGLTSLPGRSGLRRGRRPKD